MSRDFSNMKLEAAGLVSQNQEYFIVIESQLYLSHASAVSAVARTLNGHGSSTQKQHGHLSKFIQQAQYCNQMIFRQLT